MVIWNVCSCALPEVSRSNLAFQFCKLVGLAGMRRAQHSCEVFLLMIPHPSKAYVLQHEIRVFKMFLTVQPMVLILPPRGNARNSLSSQPCTSQAASSVLPQASGWVVFYQGAKL